MDFPSVHSGPVVCFAPHATRPLADASPTFSTPFEPSSDCLSHKFPPHNSAIQALGRRIAPKGTGSPPENKQDLIHRRFFAPESDRCKLQMTGSAAQHRKAIPQNPAGPKRPKSQPETMVNSAVAPPIPTVP